MNDDKYYFVMPSTSPQPPSPSPSPPSPSPALSLAPPASGSWELADEGDHWCGASHPGQAGFTQESGQALAEQYGGSWAYSAKANNGWVFCEMSLEDCQAACIAMGDCAELSVTSNSCCFPATSVCEGGRRVNDDKYYFV